MTPNVNQSEADFVKNYAALIKLMSDNNIYFEYLDDNGNVVFTTLQRNDVGKKFLYGSIGSGGGYFGEEASKDTSYIKTKYKQLTGHWADAQKVNGFYINPWIWCETKKIAKDLSRSERSF